MSRVTRGNESRRVRVEGRTPIQGHPPGMRFGFFTQPSKFFHTLYIQYKRSLSITFRGTKTRLSYMSLAIEVARSESTDLAIATAIRLRRSDR